MISKNATFVPSNWVSALMASCRKGHLGTVSYLIETHTFPPILLSEAATTATRNGHCDILKYFHSEKIVDFSTAFLIEDACQSGDLDTVKFVQQYGRFYYWIELGESVNFLHIIEHLLKDGYDPVSIVQTAIKFGTKKTMKFLISSNLISTRHFSSCFSNTCKSSKMEFLKMFLAIPGLNANHGLSTAVNNKDLRVITFLLNNRSRYTIEELNQSIVDCVKKHHDDNKVLKMLLEDPRADPGYNKNEALQYACRVGDIETVKLLIADPRVDPSFPSNNAMLIARENGHKLIEALFKC